MLYPPGTCTALRTTARPEPASLAPPRLRLPVLGSTTRELHQQPRAPPREPARPGVHRPLPRIVQTGLVLSVRLRPVPWPKPPRHGGGCRRRFSRPLPACQPPAGRLCLQQLLLVRGRGCSPRHLPGSLSLGVAVRPRLFPASPPPGGCPGPGLAGFLAWGMREREWQPLSLERSVDFWMVVMGGGIPRNCRVGGALLMPGGFRLDISQQISGLGGQEGEVEAEGGTQRICKLLCCSLCGFTLIGRSF